MPFQNRVTPEAELIATPERGTLMGNRGCLHDEQGMIRRTSVGKRWIACRLVFRGRKRAVMSPGRYTELFFLDEATALPAGHRPCAECRRGDYNAFRRAWVQANLPCLESLPSANEMDAHLHAERLDSAGEKATYPVRLDDLPDGVFIRLPDMGAPLLLRTGLLWPWTAGGYAAPFAPNGESLVTLLTPPSIASVLAAGYVLNCHVSSDLK